MFNTCFKWVLVSSSMHLRTSHGFGCLPGTVLKHYEVSAGLIRVDVEKVWNKIIIIIITLRSICGTRIIVMLSPNSQ